MPEEGFRKWMGCDYEIMEDGHAVVGLRITAEMRNLRGVVQGGVIAALVDISMATLELKVNYTAPAKGDRLTPPPMSSAPARAHRWCGARSHAKTARCARQGSVPL